MDIDLIAGAYQHTENAEQRGDVVADRVGPAQISG